MNLWKRQSLSLIKPDNPTGNVSLLQKLNERSDSLAYSNSFESVKIVGIASLTSTSSSSASSIMSVPTFDNNNNNNADMPSESLDDSLLKDTSFNVCWDDDDDDSIVVPRPKSGESMSVSIPHDPVTQAKVRARMNRFKEKDQEMMLLDNRINSVDSRSAQYEKVAKASGQCLASNKVQDRRSAHGRVTQFKEQPEVNANADINIARSDTLDSIMQMSVDDKIIAIRPLAPKVHFEEPNPTPTIYSEPVNDKSAAVPQSHQVYSTRVKASYQPVNKSSPTMFRQAHNMQHNAASHQAYNIQNAPMSYQAYNTPHITRFQYIPPPPPPPPEPVLYSGIPLIDIDRTETEGSDSFVRPDFTQIYSKYSRLETMLDETIDADTSMDVSHPSDEGQGCCVAPSMNRMSDEHIFGRSKVTVGTNFKSDEQARNSPVNVPNDTQLYDEKVCTSMSSLTDNDAYRPAQAMDRKFIVKRQESSKPNLGKLSWERSATSKIELSPIIDVHECKSETCPICTSTATTFFLQVKPIKAADIRPLAGTKWWQQDCEFEDIDAVIERISGSTKAKAEPIVKPSIVIDTTTKAEPTKAKSDRKDYWSDRLIGALLKNIEKYSASVPTCQDWSPRSVLNSPFERKTSVTTRSVSVQASAIESTADL